MRETATARIALRSASDVRNSVVVGEIPADRVSSLGDGCECVDADGKVYPAQVTADSPTAAGSWACTSNGLTPASLSLELRPAAAGDVSRGIELRRPAGKRPRSS